MCRTLICQTSFIVMLALAGNAAALIDPASVTTGHVYSFDDVSGGQVPDNSANSNTCTIVGNPQVIGGLTGKALQFNGVDDGVQVPDSANINTPGGPWPNRTVVAVFRCYDVDMPGKQTVFEEGGVTRGVNIYVSGGSVYVGGWNKGNYTPQWTPGSWISAPISSGNWYAVALVLRDGGDGQANDKFEMWLNGKLIAKAPGGQLYAHGDDGAIGYTRQNGVFHDGNASPATGHYFRGAIDEVWILNQALTESELQQWQGMIWPYAFSPNPADGAIYENTWVSLAWKPGGLAVSHNVYLSDNFDDVNNGVESVLRGNQATPSLIVGLAGFAYPEGLTPGTTYYWRVDEVNNTNPNSPWRGDVWSFMVPSRTAYSPAPSDGLKYVDPNITLGWAPGLNARLHYIHIGESFDDVNNAAGGLPQTTTTYSPAALEFGKTYYWRIDEFDGATTHKGQVWSFETIPVIPIADPNLVLRWTLDEAEGRTVVDWSGHGNNAQFTGNPQWTEGYVGSALSFNGRGDSVIYRFADETWSAYTVAVWAKASVLSQDNNSSICATYGTATTSGFQISFDAGNTYRYHSGIDQNIGSASLSWVHLAVTYDGTIATAYYNGQAVVTFTPPDVDLTQNKFAISVNRAEDNWFEGAIDDFRVYNRALSAEEVLLAMRIDPLLAWKPGPIDGSTQDIEHVTPLTWTRGDKASQHEVYLGLDKTAVTDADASDTTGVYRGRQSTTSYTPAEGLAWGGGPYFWRVDENNNDGTVTKGRIWSFSVGDFLVVDDIESYNDILETDPGSNRIYLSWVDGYGTTTNGAFVGNLNVPLAERANPHGGVQAMPLSYDNNLKFSEATLTLTSGKDWTRQGVTDLSLWYRGVAANVGERMYVALNGTAVVYNADPNAVQKTLWTEWVIPLQQFADQGVSLTNVTSITIGFGTRGNTTLPGGTGQMYFDDIRLYRPKIAP